MDDLERELRDLSSWLETPEPPEITARVRARIAAPMPRRLRTAGPAPRRRRWRYYLGATLVALVVAVLPPGRAAVADVVAGLLRFAGVTITTSPTPAPPTSTPSPLPSQQAVALHEAQRMVLFPILTPARLGPAERIEVADPDDAGAYRVATLLYRGGALRIDAFDGRLDPVFQKQASGPGTEMVQVDAGFAVWVAGPHTLTYVDRSGRARTETARLATSTLIWERAGVSYRLEGDLTQREAIAIANSVA
ncbi:hypothetical protein [Micromonospora sp. WMMD812]|uniref:hypothetical protein n=1 Tax=Micromonospora sp. WMMD812 TaxID=3015152 RepID=UPI00248BDF96|nr:hypothetical protein [Micromonospora sp. WMMD812]WBB68478.1 hypothetical protein O7603_03600 [Micromonospora sp. WMMD812]